MLICLRKRFSVITLHRSFYPHSGFFHSQLPVVESSTSVVSSVWREVCKVGLEKNVADSCSHGLMEQMALLGLSKVSAALADCSTQVELPALAVGLLNRLRHLLEKLTSVASVRHSPLLWRLLIWAASLLTSRLEAKDAAEELKTVLYRAIQVMQRCSQFVRDINNVYFRMCPGTRHYTLTLPSI